MNKIKRTNRKAETETKVKTEEKPPSIEELKQLTENAPMRENTQEFTEMQVKEATKQAFRTVVRGAVEKMRISAQNGYTRAYLYNWEFTTDPTDMTYAFNGIRFSYLIRNTNLSQQLTDYFNQSATEKNKYRVGIYSNKTTHQQQRRRWGLYVSWYQPQPKEETNETTETDETDETKENGNTEEEEKEEDTEKAEDEKVEASVQPSASAKTSKKKR